jgi:hypothetical protein
VLKIDRLRLTLPPGHERRAAAIGRLVAEELARHPLPEGADLAAERLEAPAVRVGRGATDRGIAGEVARAITRQLGRSTGGGGR